MRTSSLIYEGDGLFHRAPTVKGPAAAGGRPQTAGDGGNAVDLAERRGAAMRRLFPKLSAWLASAGFQARSQEVHRYLEQATNVFDLEERIRRIERSGGHVPYF